MIASTNESILSKQASKPDAVEANMSESRSSSSIAISTSVPVYDTVNGEMLIVLFLKLINEKWTRLIN